MEKLNYEGKRKAPNGMFWGNSKIHDRNKCVMCEQINEIEFRVWSNSKLASFDETFTPSRKREGWYYKDVLHDEITFFNWN